MPPTAPLHRPLLSAALAIGILAGTAQTTATAQDELPSIGVVDVQMILRNSKASKSVRPQVEKLRKDYQDSVREREAELRKASQELQRQRAILSPQAFAKRRGAYEERARKAQVDFQNRKRRLDDAYSTAMRAVHRSMVIAAAKIAEEREFDVVLPKSLVLLADQKLDITTEVLRRVDETLPSIEVSVKKDPDRTAPAPNN